MDKLQEEFRKYQSWLTKHPNASLVKLPRSDGNIELYYRDGKEIFVAVTDLPQQMFYGCRDDLRLH